MRNSGGTGGRRTGLKAGAGISAKEKREKSFNVRGPKSRRLCKKVKGTRGG